MCGLCAALNVMGTAHLRIIAAMLAAVLFGWCAVAGAVPLELMTVPSEGESEDDSSLVIDELVRAADTDQSIISLMPQLMPLFAVSRFSAYTENSLPSMSAEGDEWSSNNSQWLRAMLPTILAVRRKADDDRILLFSRRREREQRTRVAPRAGRPEVLDAEPEEPRLGVRLVDVLLRNSRGSRANVSPHVADGGYREVNPFDRQIGDGGLGSYVLSAEIDAVTAERLDQTASNDNDNVLSPATVIDAATTVALQLNRLDHQYRDLTRGGNLGGSVGSSSLNRNLIDVGSHHAQQPKNRREPKTKETIRLTSFLVDLALSISTSPMTYLVAIPVGFGWVLVRVARSKRV